MENILPLLIILFWVVIGIPVSIAKKNAQYKARPGARKEPAGAQPPAASQQQSAEPEQRTAPLAPTVSVTRNDDSIYRGSLNAVTGEGYDPCHEEQLSPLAEARETIPEFSAQEAPASLPFGWTGSDMVRGIVMSEILKKKR